LKISHHHRKDFGHPFLTSGFPGVKRPNFFGSWPAFAFLSIVRIGKNETSKDLLLFYFLKININSFRTSDLKEISGFHSLILGELSNPMNT